MPVTLAVWSMIISPRERVDVRLPADLRLTNASLGMDLADPRGRTCLALYHEDLTGEEEVGQDDVKPGKSGQEVKEQTNAERDNETKHFVLCSLTPGKIEQALLDIVLSEGENYAFFVDGVNAIMLAGNYIDQDVPDVPDEVQVLQLENDALLQEHRMEEKAKDNEPEQHVKLQGQAHSPKPRGKRDRSVDEEEPQNAQKKHRTRVAATRPREQPVEQKRRELSKRGDSKGKQPERQAAQPVEAHRKGHNKIRS